MVMTRKSYQLQLQLEKAGCSSATKRPSSDVLSSPCPEKRKKGTSTESPYTDLDVVKGTYFEGVKLEVQDNDAVFDLNHGELFTTAWNDFLQILTDDVEPKGRKRKLRKRAVPYASILTALEEHAEEHGFTDVELETIWKVASSSNAGMNCTQRRRLIMTMIPKHKVNDNVIKSIVWWLWTVSANSFNPSVVVAVYQLLNFYAEYHLVEANAISNESVLTRMLTTPTENLVIPWKMYLFRNIVSPCTLRQLHVYHLNNMLSIKDVKKTQIADITSSIGLCKHLNPKMYVTNNEGRNLYVKSRQLKYPSPAVERFEKCKLRLKSEIPVGNHPMADRIFPEFLPVTLNTGAFASNTRVDTMLELLCTEEGVIKLTLDPLMLQVFGKWFQLVVLHRVHSFAEIISELDAQRYGFILNRYLLIVKIRQEGLKTIDQWLVKLLPSWDFNLFQGLIFTLLPYVHPNDILPRGALIAEVFVDRFTHSSETRMSIWKCLTSMRDMWLSRILTNKQNDDEQSFVEGLIWVLDLAFRLVDSVIAAFEIGSDFDVRLTYKMCTFYNDLLVEEQKISSEALREKLFHLPNGLFSIVTLSQSLSCVRVGFAIMARVRHLAKDVLTEPLRSNKMLMDGLVCNAMASYVQNLEVFPEVLLKVIVDDFVDFNQRHSNSLKEIWKGHYPQQLAITASSPEMDIDLSDNVDEL